MSPSLRPKSLSVFSPFKDIRDALVNVSPSSRMKPLPKESSNCNPKIVVALPFNTKLEPSSLTKVCTYFDLIAPPIPE